MEDINNNKFDKMDILKATGQVTVLEKAYSLSTFMSKEMTDYNPLILFATSDATNTDIDSNEIYCLIYLDIPSSCVDIVQEREVELGNLRMSIQVYAPTTFFSLKSFKYKQHKILRRHNAILDDLYHKEIRIELMETLKVLTIPQKLSTQELEEAMANPNFDINSNLQVCGCCFV